MTFDLAKTVALARGGLLDHDNTWKSYLEPNPAWKDTALVLTVPLILTNVLLSLLFSRMSGGFAFYDPGYGVLTALVIGLLMAVIAVAVASFVFHYLAGVFGGKPDFSRSFGAVSLAMIPAWVAGVVGSLIPWVGWLIAIAGGITSLVFLYKIMPLALGIPENKRALHFVVSIVAIFVIQVLVGMLVAGDRGFDPDRYRGSSVDGDGSPTFGSGFLGEMERQGRLYDTAQNSVFEPPEDGELERKQVVRYVGFLDKARDLQAKYASDMQKLAEDLEQKENAGENPSGEELTRIYSGVGDAVGANNAEMEIVVTGGGNWAEHQWVAEQLRIASIQQGEGPDPIPHNYELYLAFKDEIEAKP